MKTGRITAYAGPPLPAYSEMTTDVVIASLLQGVLVGKQDPKAALAEFITSAKGYCAKS